MAMAQNRINGKVTDNQNLPLAGVNVTIKNKSSATFTDAAGNYSLAVSPERYIGFYFHRLFEKK